MVTFNASTAATESVGTNGVRINTSADTLAGTAGTGGFFVDEADDVLVSTIAVTGAGNVVVTSAVGNIDEDVDDTTVNISTGGTVSLTASTSIGTDGANGLDVQSSDLTLDAPSVNVVVPTGTDLEALSVATDLSGATRMVTADNFTFIISDDNTDFTLTNLTKSAGGTFDFDLTTNNGGIFVGTIDVNGGDVNLTSTVDFIRDLTADAVVDITANSLILSAATDIGTAANAIETAVTKFEAA